MDIKIEDDLQKQKRIKKQELGDFYYSSVMSHFKIIAPLIKLVKTIIKIKRKILCKVKNLINLIKTF